MTTNTCKYCGCLLGVPWSGGHGTQCPSYQPPPSARQCDLCRSPMTVTSIRSDAYGTVVHFACRAGCEVEWDESTGDDEAAALVTRDAPQRKW